MLVLAFRCCVRVMSKMTDALAVETCTCFLLTVLVQAGSNGIELVHKAHGIVTVPV